MADPIFWLPHFEGVNFARALEADFEVGDHRYGVFAHDWRTEPVSAWMMGARIPMQFAPSPARGPTTETVLSEPEFRQAVRSALRDFRRPEILARNPLAYARMLRDSDTADRGGHLQTILRKAAESLKAHPKDHKLYRALWHTYFEPLETQELVAERLGLPFSTYRHHLRKGTERIADWLWHRECSVYLG